VFSLTLEILESVLLDETSTKREFKDSTKDPPGESTSVILTLMVIGLTIWNEVSVVVGAKATRTNEFLFLPVAKLSLGARRVIV
jgi:hypothetical protein